MGKLKERKTEESQDRDDGGLQQWMAEKSEDWKAAWLEALGVGRSAQGSTLAEPAPLGPESAAPAPGLTDVDIRRGRSGDEVGILRVLAAAFKTEPGSPGWERRRQEVESDPAAFRVLTVAGEIASVARIRKHELQIGSCAVIKGDVGLVGTHPDHERRGLATRLMADLVEWMRGEGYHLSRLGGYCRFYGRFGYVPFPRGQILFPLKGLSSRGGLTDPEAVLSAPSEPEAAVRPYHAGKDHVRRAALYRRFNAGRTGAQPRESADASESEEDPWRVVVERDGKVRGYMFAAEPGTGPGSSEPESQIADAAIDPAYPEVLVPLLRHTLLKAYRAGAARVTARLPLDYSLYRWYREGSLGFTPALCQTTESGNMLQVLNLAGILSQITPELQRRLIAISLGYEVPRISFNVGGQLARLAVQRSWAYAEPQEEVSISLDQEAFLYLLLGLKSIDEIAAATLPMAPEYKALLGALFPVQPTATGLWG
ncbi:MAG: GNAT family N-acetyltransferase [Kiritimatiellae bacterium]|nr:GNAT family N-acetyltransferase [Kiritimatiellia bacterium]